MSKKKIPIDESGKGNCCPECGSFRISADEQYSFCAEKDLSTGKEIFRDDSGKRIRPTNKLLAEKYQYERMGCQCIVYRCRKCGWISDTVAMG